MRIERDYLLIPIYSIDHLDFDDLINWADQRRRNDFLEMDGYSSGLIKFELLSE